MSKAGEDYGSLTPFAEPSWYSGLPSPYYKEKHKVLRDAVRKWVDEHLMDTAEWEEKKSIDHAVFQAAARDGLLLPNFGGAKIPKEWEKYGKIIGGLKAEEWDSFCDLIIQDELSRGGGAAGLFAGGMYGAPLLYKYGAKSLVDKYLPDILQGKTRICIALTEPEAGSDVKNLSTSAVRSADGKHWVVNGVKKWITNGIYSDFFATAVRTRGKAGDPNGISLLLIPRTTGVTTQQIFVGGGSSAGTTLVTFNNVHVPIENLIGTENEGLKCVFHNFNHERVTIAFSANRMARNCIEDAIQYVHKRVVYGKPLIDLGVVRHKLAHCARLIESQQAWIEALTYQLDNLTPEEGNRLLGGQTALLKAHCGIVAKYVADECTQLFGGLGFTIGGRGERVEASWRGVKGIMIPGGAEDVMLDLGIRQQIKIATGKGAKL